MNAIYAQTETLEDGLDTEPTALAKALGHPVRVRILRLLAPRLVRLHDLLTEVLAEATPIEEDNRGCC